jgi:hypothetical protein
MVIIMQTNLLSVLTTIGSIAETNPSYFYYLESQLKKPVEELTILQLLAAHSECRYQYNEKLSDVKSQEYHAPVDNVINAGAVNIFLNNEVMK